MTHQWSTTSDNQTIFILSACYCILYNKVAHSQDNSALKTALKMLKVRELKTNSHAWFTEMRSSYCPTLVRIGTNTDYLGKIALQVGTDL